MDEIEFQNGWEGEVRLSKLHDIELKERCCVPSCDEQGVEMHLYSTDGWQSLCRQHADEAWGKSVKPWHTDQSLPIAVSKLRRIRQTGEDGVIGTRDAKVLLRYLDDLSKKAGVGPTGEVGPHGHPGCAGPS